MTRRAFALLGGIPLFSQTPSLAIVNARVWNPSFGHAATAVAITGERIAVVGSNDDVLKRKPARVIDANGGSLVPGFHDTHIHLVTGGFRLLSVQLRGAKTKQEFIARIRDYAAKQRAGTWITGGDWDHTVWGGDLPTREWIDGVTRDHPVWINRLDGHMALANSRALAAAGISKQTRDIEGGAIVRDAAGNPTGLLKDNAMRLMDRVVPAPSPEQSDKALDAAIRYVAAQGVTSVHNMGTWADVDTFERARNSGRLKIRVYAAVPLNTWEKLRDRIAANGRGDNWLKIGGLKGFVDGSLGSHTAAMLEPFNDAPQDRGLMVNTPEDLYQWTSGATRAGLHVMVHAIGDRAIRTQLDIFERVLREQKPKDPRFRIEHAQHIAPADIPRFGKLGVIASMQPYHCIDDGRWATNVIGRERSRTTYAFRSLLDHKAKLAFGSDWFVAPATPLEGIFAALTRQTLDDRNPGGWVPEQKIALDEALRAYTSDAAFASFDESLKGTIQPGKLADMVLLGADLTRTPPHQLKSVPVRMTIAGGQIAHELK